MSSQAQHLDALVVGAGFSGIYMLHKLREFGFSCKVLEKASGVGGTWFWNRYPGARCDIESNDYCYSFSDELQKEWNWERRYPTQPEVLKYLHFVCDKLSLRDGIQLNTTVCEARYDDARGIWNVTTSSNEKYSATYLIMATGCLSVASAPNIPGLDKFEGLVLKTSEWPHESPDLVNKRVALIGTGSSGVQSAPVIARDAAKLTVFLRTPSYSSPAHDHALDDGQRQEMKKNFKEHRDKLGKTWAAISNSADDAPVPTFSVSEDEIQKAFEHKWSVGGMSIINTFADSIVDEKANKLLSDFIKRKINETVTNPHAAKILTSHDYPVGAKRTCVDVGFFGTFNRENVELVNLRESPITEITKSSVVTKSGKHDVDVIVLATGFKALVGALFNANIHGKNGVKLNDKWADGPKTYLGLQTAGFPNLFTITGPGSPSVLSNMIYSIEQHVEYVADLLKYMRDHNQSIIEASEAAENEWTQLVAAIPTMLYATSYNRSWYNFEAADPNKPKVFMPFVGGIDKYKAKCEDVASKGYEGFELSNSGGHHNTTSNSKL